MQQRGAWTSKGSLNQLDGKSKVGEGLSQKSVTEGEG